MSCTPNFMLGPCFIFYVEGSREAAAFSNTHGSSRGDRDDWGYCSSHHKAETTR